MASYTAVGISEFAASNTGAVAAKFSYTPFGEVIDSTILQLGVTFQ